MTWKVFFFFCLPSMDCSSQSLQNPEFSNWLISGRGQNSCRECRCFYRVHRLIFLLCPFRWLKINPTMKSSTLCSVGIGRFRWKSNYKIDRIARFWQPLVLRGAYRTLGSNDDTLPITHFINLFSFVYIWLLLYITWYTKKVNKKICCVIKIKGYS